MMQSVFLGLDVYQWYIVGVIAGLTFLKALEFWRKWIGSGKTIPFNLAFIVNAATSMAIAIYTGYGVFLPLWETYTIVHWPVAFVVGFILAAGFDKGIIEFLLKLVNFHEKAANRYPWLLRDVGTPEEYES